MKKTNFTNQELNNIENGIFKSFRLSDDELNKFINESPDLFTAIKTRIRQEKVQTEDIQPASSWLLPSFNLKMAAALFGLFGLLVFFGWSHLNRSAQELAASQAKFEAPSPEAENTLFHSPSDISSQMNEGIEPEKTTAETKLKLPVKSRFGLKASPKTSQTRLNARRKVNEINLIAKKLPAQTIEDSGVFLPVRGGGNPDLSNEGSSIVRVEISRAELLVLGIDVLTDIGEAKIEAELLLGNNGEPRGIRLLK